LPRQTSRDLRNESRFEVLHALFSLGPSTRQEIAKHTGLSTATVATLVTQFLAEGVLRIATVEQNTVGRPYERLSIDPDRGRILGIDVAETYVHVELFDPALTVLASVEETLHPEEARPEQVVAHILSSLRHALDQAGVPHGRVLGVGVSVDGHSDERLGLSRIDDHVYDR
jgi:predicted ArsR family transcriptional regulator